MSSQAASEEFQRQREDKAEAWWVSVVRCHRIGMGESR